MTTETKPKNGILSDLELASVEVRERAALPWEVDLRVKRELQQGRRWPDLHPPIGDREGAIRAANAVLDWQTSTLRRFTVGYDAGWLLLEVPSEDWDRWARRQGRARAAGRTPLRRRRRGLDALRARRLRRIRHRLRGGANANAAAERVDRLRAFETRGRGVVGRGLRGGAERAGAAAVRGLLGDGAMRRIDPKTGRPTDERYPESETYAEPAAAKWFIVLANGIIPGLIVLACVLSHRDWLRTLGWILAFGLLFVECVSLAAFMADGATE